MTQTMQQAPAQTTQQPDQPEYQITDADRDRVKRIEDAWTAYRGELTKPLKQMDDQPDDNVLSNRCKAVVRMGVGFLFGKELEITCEEGAPQEAQDFLNKLWGRKEARVPLLQELAINGAMTGIACLRIVPNGNDFRLVVVDPSIVYIKTAPQDCKTVLLYCLQYSNREMVNGRMQEVYYREEIKRLDPDTEAFEDENADGLDDDVTWQVQHWTQVGAVNMQPRNNQWIPAGKPYIWPYPFAPVFHTQNMVIPNDPWGEPDITPDLIGNNNALNLVLSDINRIEKIYGDPWIWGSGFAESVIPKQPGRVTLVPEGGKIDSVKIISDVPNALVFAADLRSDMDETTRTPGVATGRMKDMPRGNVSGIALELLFQPLLMKTEEKRCLYGELIITVSQALLQLGNFSEDIDISLTWANPLPSDNLQAAQTAMLWKQVGVSDATIFRSLGLDPDEEVKQSQDEDQQKMMAFSRGQGMPPPGMMMTPNATVPPPTPGAPPPGQQAPGGSPFIGGH